MVHFIQEKTIQHLKKVVSQLEFMEYFSDGYTDQYKNKKSYHNLCAHEKDFGIKASWSFIATRHGKSPCDGIGRTVERSTAMESLRWPLEHQIFNINEMVAYCSKTLTSITFQILPKEELKSHQVKLKELIGLVSLFTCSPAIVSFFIVAKPNSTGLQKATICSVTQQEKSQNHGNATILPQ